jgi:hypothetical protein
MTKEATEKKPKGTPSGAAQSEKKPKAKPSSEAPQKAKPDKAKPDKATDTAAAEKEKTPKAPPRPPADPRLKVLKKFHGKFLPRGPLRDRYKALMARWISDENHGGVTAYDLKSLYDDWKQSRQKPPRPVRASG